MSEQLTTGEPGVEKYEIASDEDPSVIAIAETVRRSQRRNSVATSISNSWTTLGAPKPSSRRSPSTPRTRATSSAGSPTTLVRIRFEGYSGRTPPTATHTSRSISRSEARPLGAKSREGYAAASTNWLASRAVDAPSRPRPAGNRLGRVRGLNILRHRYRTSPTGAGYCTIDRRLGGREQ